MKFGVGFAVKDSDDPDDLGYYGGWWLNSGDSDLSFNADAMVDFFLAPSLGSGSLLVPDRMELNGGFYPTFDVNWCATVVAPDTWGRIKSTFSN